MTSPVKPTLPKISHLDRQDLEKYIKFFTFKFVQVVVQARCGERLDGRLDSKKLHWFNLAIEDVNEIALETDHILGHKMPCFDGQTVNVELSTCTSNCETDGNFKTAIEVWSLSLNEDLSCPDILITHGVYNKLSILLKSILCVTRLIPGYKTSLIKQGSDSFIICYNVYLQEPDVSVLDANYKTITVGKVGTPMGTLSLSVHYRTSFIDASQKYNCLVDKFEYVNSVSSEMKIIASKGSQENCETMKAADTSGVSSCSSSTSSNIDNSEQQLDICKCEDPHKVFDKSKKLGAFVTPLTSKECDISKEDFIYIPEVPFMSLFSDHLKNWSENEQKSNCDNKNCTNMSLNNSNNISPNDIDVDFDKEGTLPEESETNSANSLVNGRATKSEDSSSSYDEDDFVHVILKTPFAKPQKNELAEFINDCRSAPELKSFLEDDVTLLDQVDILNDRFAEFESNLGKYDSFVKSLREDNDESD